MTSDPFPPNAEPKGRTRIGPVPKPTKPTTKTNIFSDDPLI